MTALNVTELKLGCETKFEPMLVVRIQVNGTISLCKRIGYSRRESVQYNSTIKDGNLQFRKPVTAADTEKGIGYVILCKKETRLDVY